MDIYHLENAETPWVNAWGDWGVALVYGAIGEPDSEDEDTIVRAGPYTPLAYKLSGYFVLTQPIKEALENSGLAGMGPFVHMRKSRIVELDWSDWDTDSDIAEYLDQEGEPLDILESRPHDPALAQRMPEYWEAPIVGRIALVKDRTKLDLCLSEYLRVAQADERIDFFKGDVHGGWFVSERAKQWLERYCPGCFQFTRIAKAPGENGAGV